MAAVEKRQHAYVGAKLVLLALLVVWLLRTCCFELYRVPSSQMESSIETGDRLFVNKWSYGLRLPMAWVAIPFTHDSIGGLCSYSTLLQLPYIRLFSKPVERNEVAVFNHPLPPYQQLPIDRRKVSLSRCVALPGDTVRYTNGDLYVNEQLQPQSPQQLAAYYYREADMPDVQRALQANGVVEREAERIEGVRVALFTRLEYHKLLASFGNDSLVKPIHNPADNFRIVLPKQRTATAITSQNIGMLLPLIVLHEGEKAVRVGDTIEINGKKITHYVFHQDYYWMMCDNRVASLDSRHFGAVPHSHLVGRASHLAYSTAQLSRMLQPIH